MNNNQHFTEADWKLFRKKIAGWQEAYMEKLVREYVDLLSEDGSASDKFWALEKRIKKDKQKTGVVVDMRRSMMIQNILQLLGEGRLRLTILTDSARNCVRQSDLSGITGESENDMPRHNPSAGIIA